MGQAAGRRARARRRADAGPALRDPADGAPRRRGREGRAAEDAATRGASRSRACWTSTGAASAPPICATTSRSRASRSTSSIRKAARSSSAWCRASTWSPRTCARARCARSASAPRRSRRSRPRTISVSISGFGSGGESPYASWPSYAPVAEAMGGLYEPNRKPDQPPPVVVAGALGDVGTRALRRDRHARRAAPPRAHGARPARRPRHVRRDARDLRHAASSVVDGRPRALGRLGLARRLRGLPGARRPLRGGGLSRAPVPEAGPRGRSSRVVRRPALRDPRGLGPATPTP